MLLRGVAIAGLASSILACAAPVADVPSITADEYAAEQQRQLAFQLQTFVVQSARLYSVYHRIAAANAEFCGPKVAPRLGFRAVTEPDLPERYREVGPAALNLDPRQPTVIAVAESGPAGRAGLAVGDVVLAFNGRRVPKWDSAEWIEKFLASPERTAIRVDIRRQGKELSLNMAPEIACAYPIHLAADNTVNAYTDGRRVVVFSGMLRFAQTDAELATVVGHELAHITMSHIEKGKENVVVGTIGGFIVDVALAAVGVNAQGAFTRKFGEMGNRLFAMDFEREADYVGAYYVARAGFDIAQAEGFWRTIARENPQGIFFAGLHPTSPERFLLMQRTSEEIAHKRRLNLALRPELRRAATAPTPAPAPALASRD